jgi:thymidylate synthase
MNTADTAWLDLLSRIGNYGSVEAPRGLKTLELIGAQTTFSMQYPVVTIKRRELGYRFLAAEAWWILTGSNKVVDMAPYSKMIPKFSDDGLTFKGAYGPKVIEQLPYVADCLVNDPSSRQAVLTIWRERPGPSKDVPCTVSAQWFIRDDRLHCSLTMRSSDAWLGVPYDWLNFSMVSAFLIAYMRQVRVNRSLPAVNIELGNMVFTAGSQHLYEQHWEPALECRKDTTTLFDYAPLSMLSWDAGPYDIADHLKALADRKQHDCKGPFLDEIFNLFKDKNRDDAEGKPRGY